jgi:hypothetical protein
MISGRGIRSAQLFTRCLHFSQHRRWIHGFRELPGPTLTPLAVKLWIVETELSGSAQNDGNAGAGQGVGEGHQAIFPVTSQQREGKGM